MVYTTLIPTLFGLGCLLVTTLAWASGSHVNQKIALVLLFAWCATMIVSALGLARENLMLPSIDAIAAIVVAQIGGKRFPPIAVVVFGLYAVVGLVHVLARVLAMQETYTYFATLGYLFLAQLLTVGALSGRLAIHRWSAAGRERPRLDLARW